MIQIQFHIGLQCRRQLPGAAAKKIDVLLLGLDLAVLLRRIDEAAAARIALRVRGEIAAGGAGEGARKAHAAQVAAVIVIEGVGIAHIAVDCAAGRIVVGDGAGATE